MTVSILINKISYAGDGSTVNFNYTFEITAAADLKVLVVNDATGVETTLIKDVDYTVAGAGNPSGGSITLTAGSLCPVDNTLVMYRDTPITQSIDFTPGGPFPSESHEDGLDRLTLVVQELQEAVDRAVKTSIGAAEVTGVSDITIPVGANQILAWDATGTNLILLPIGTPIATTDIFDSLSAHSDDLATAVSAIGSNHVTLVMDVPNTVSDNLTVPKNIQLLMTAPGITTIASGKTLTIYGAIFGGIDEYFSGDGSVSIASGSGIASNISYAVAQWFGAKGDGSTDDSAAIAKTIAAVQPGGRIYFPRGEYVCDSGFTIDKNNITFFGDSMSNGADQTDGALKSSVLRFTPGTGDFITVYNAAATTHNFRVEGMFIKGSTTGALMTYKNIHRPFLRDVMVVNNVNGAGKGVVMTNAQAVHMQDVIIYKHTNARAAGSVGLQIISDSAAFRWYANKFDNVTVHQWETGLQIGQGTYGSGYQHPAMNMGQMLFLENGVGALVQDGAYNSNFDGCHFFSNTVAGAKVKLGAKNTHFKGCTFDNDSVSDAEIVIGDTGAASNQYFWNASVERCSFVNCDVLGIKSNLDASNSKNLTIRECLFEGSGTGLTVEHIAGGTAYVQQLEIWNNFYGAGITAAAGNTFFNMRAGYDEGQLIGASGYSSRTMAADYTLKIGDGVVQTFFPTSPSLKVILPNVSTGGRYKFFLLYNAAAGNSILVRDGADTTTLVTLAPSLKAIAWVSGGSYHASII